MQIVDCTTHFGQYTDRAVDVSLSTLLDDLTAHRIAQAWTYSLRGVTHLGDDANRETLAATRTHSSLVPVATIDPKRYHGQTQEIDWCLGTAIRLFRFFPQEQGWQVTSLPFQTLLDQLRGTGVALILSAAESGAATAIGQATVDNGLPVLLVDVHYEQMAECIVAMQHWPHLYAATNRLGTSGAIETLVREVGADRILFGSEAPDRPVQCALNQVWFANLLEEERSAIFGGNARRLCGEPSTSSPGDPARGTRATTPDSTPQCEPPPRSSVPIIDVHAHLGRFSFPVNDERGIAGIEANRQQHNIDRVIVSSTDGILYDLVAGNRVVQESIADYPWLLGYVVTNPNYLTESAAEMDRYYRDAKFVGAKIHAEFAHTPTSSPRMQELFAEIAKRGKPVKIHNAGTDWALALLKLARAFPHLTIIIAHAGLGMPSVEAIEVAASTDNVYLEFCTTWPKRGIIREAIVRAGVEKILFGSDQLLIDPGYVLGAYQDAVPSAEEWASIAWHNPRRLFGL